MMRGRRGALCKIVSMALLLCASPLPMGHSQGAADCCVALEDRVAELEATALRKGSSGTLQIYGQVNRAVLFWNDSFDARAAVVDNTTSSTRMGFIGQAKIRPGLSAGYRIEFEYLMPASSQIYNPSDVTHAEPMTTSISMRQAYWSVTDDKLGTVSLGHQWSATGTITLINLGSQMNDAALHYNNAFSIGLSVAGGIFSDLKWGQIAHDVDTLRGDYLRYDTPLMLGFVLSASIGEEDAWDVALRYQADGHAFRFAAGIGYRHDGALQLTELKGAASLLHLETGLYASVAGGLRDDERSSLIGPPPAYFHYVQAGISRKWLAYGNTTVYADFGIYKNFNVGELLRIDPHTGQLAIWGTLAETETVRWGYGIEQAFDEAGLLLYAQAHHYQANIIGFPCDPNPGQFPNNCGGDPSNLVSLPMRPWSGYVVGARIRF